MTRAATDPTPLDFFFDPVCPFTWATSRWATEVAATGAATVTWRLMSLGVLNEGKEIPEQFRAGMAQGARALRALAAAADEGGNDAVAALYTALGTRRHGKGEPYSDEVIADAVAEAGLPASVAAAVDDEARDAAVRASHEQSQAAVGQESGSPVLRIGEVGWFGPVVAPSPTGDEALRLFDALRTLATVPSFSELKTSRGAL
ncbi:DsbA family protein [Pseudonocardia lacus]|uniref:DsbA family protein n=1 Tax=Pseudonocardia lacus TaxID=2835865 RepID=UPI001BDD2D14|nr:DsbA family protein [Pseudonocardia lacus]